MLRKRRAQSTLEYALVIAAVVAALVAVNVYVKKGIQGRLKESTDQVGKQFDPTSVTYSWKTESSSNAVTQETRDIATGDTTSNITSGETLTKSEHETFGTAPGQHY